MKNKLLSIFALALLPAFLAAPTAAQADPNCVGSECEVTFEYTGAVQEFQVPQDATNIRFEVYGAAGGRGAAGGAVTGNFTSLPPTLLVYVGGAGRMGAGAQGGFNGGGYAGGNSGTEGSGGGASDIRIAQGLDSRLVVAGGGGGGGGEAGGGGGSGGGLSAAYGGSGQASGGGGGTQSEGGYQGASNGGFQQATRGQFGAGGAGGFASFAGGGGGGGGWYGGGGGGSDDNTCCSDGAGGGGGSSYADPAYTSSVSHSSGVRWGNGKVVLRYTLPPRVLSFQLLQVDASTLSFSITGSESLTGFEQNDLAVSGVGCEISTFVTDQNGADGTLTGCESGPVTLTIAANSFGSTITGPSVPISQSIEFDADPPTLEFNLLQSLTNSSSLSIPYVTSESVSLTEDNFEIVGCQAIEILELTIGLSECVAGEGSLTLRAGTLVDTWGNQGPMEPQVLLFTIDLEAPSAQWTEISLQGEGPFSYQAVLQFSEPVTLSDQLLSLESTADCSFDQTVEQDRIVVNSECGYSTLRWTFTGTLTDMAGNQSTLSTYSVEYDNHEPTPEPTPTPEPIPALEPPQFPEPVNSSGQQPESVQVPESLPSPEPVVSAPDLEQAEISETEPVETAPPSDQETLIPEVEPARAEAAAVAPRSIEKQPRIEITETAIEPAPSQAIEIAESVSQNGDAESSPETEEQVQAVPVAISPVVNLDEVSDNGESPTGEFPWLALVLTLGLGLIGFGAWRFSGR